MKLDDKVTIRSWEDLVTQYGRDSFGDIVNDRIRFNKEMKPFCGRECTISNVGEPLHNSGKRFELAEDAMKWNWFSWMFQTPKQDGVRELFFYSDHNLSNRVTVCGIYENGSLRFSAARTSDNDKFVRKIGRAKARGRAVSHPIVTVGAVQEETLIKTFNEHAKRIANIVRITPAFNEKECLFTSS